MFPKAKKASQRGNMVPKAKKAEERAKKAEAKTTARRGGKAAPHHLHGRTKSGPDINSRRELTSLHV